MRLLEALCVALIGLVSVGLDIIMFFVLVRLITLHWPIRTLLAFDRVGQPLVNPVVLAVQRALPSHWLGQEPRRTQLVIAATLLAVSLCRFAISHAEHVAIVALSYASAVPMSELFHEAVLRTIRIPAIRPASRTAVRPEADGCWKDEPGTRCRNSRREHGSPGDGATP